MHIDSPFLGVVTCEIGKQESAEDFHGPLHYLFNGGSTGDACSLAAEENHDERSSDHVQNDIGVTSVLKMLEPWETREGLQPCEAWPVLGSLADAAEHAHIPTSLLEMMNPGELEMACSRAQRGRFKARTPARPHMTPVSRHY